MTTNAATVNYVSEIGFICNPNKGKSTPAVDSITGATYISEIQSVIENNGFFPLSAGGSSGTVNQTAIDEGHVGHPARALLIRGSTGLYGTRSTSRSTPSPRTRTPATRWASA